MKFSLVHQPAALASVSPYRLINHEGQEITWANDFLDAQHIRQLSPRSLRSYGYDLLHFARWHLQHSAPILQEMDESTLLDYVRDQLNEDPKPTPQTINHRLGALGPPLGGAGRGAGKPRHADGERDGTRQVVRFPAHAVAHGAARGNPRMRLVDLALDGAAEKRRIIR